MDVIYFDNAATSWPKPPEVIAAMVAFAESVGANPGRSGHRMSIEASRIVYEAREAVAFLIGCTDPLRIVFTKNATEALNIALFGTIRAGDRVIVSGMEHNSVMRPLRFLERQGVTVSCAASSADGVVDSDDIRNMARSGARAIVINHVSNVTGVIQPLEEIGAVAQEYGALFLVDAAQSCGCIPIDVKKLGIDILCFTGHKSLLGPQGTGGLYVREGVEKEIVPLLRGGSGSRSDSEEQPDFLPDMLEAGTPNTIGIAGLAAGVRYVLDCSVESIRRREMILAKRFLGGAETIQGVTQYGSADPRKRTAVFSFTVDGMSPSETAFLLDERFQIMCRPGLQCAPAAHRTLGTFPQGTVRFSFGPFTREDEIDKALKALEALSRETKTKSGGTYE